MARTKLLDEHVIRIGLRVPVDVATKIILESRIRRVPESVIVTEVLRAYWGIDKAPEDILEPKNTPEPESKPCPDPMIEQSVSPAKIDEPKAVVTPNLGPAPEPEIKSIVKLVKREPKPSPPCTEKERLQAEVYPFTLKRIEEALRACGGRQKDLTKALGLANISVWKTSGVPQKWWPKIRAYLVDLGWTPPIQQESMFD